MNRQIRILSNNEAQVTKDFQKKAMIFGTDEYKLWKAFIAENPNCKMVTKSIRKKDGKKTNRNKTYANMEKFIREQKNAEVLLREFESVRNKAQVMPSPYHHVVAWFETKFANEESFNLFFNTTEIISNREEMLA